MLIFVWTVPLRKENRLLFFFNDKSSLKTWKLKIFHLITQSFVVLSVIQPYLKTKFICVTPWVAFLSLVRVWMIDLAEVCFLSLSSCKLWNLWWLFRQDFMQSTPLSCLYNMDQGCSYYWIHQGPFTASFKPQSCTRREKERETMFLFLVFFF